MQTPVLLLMFNRPSETKRVFEEIRKAKPTRFFIAADGPRENHPNDTVKCIETRGIVGDIDWQCEVKTLFRGENLGCKIAVSSAIDWFFQNVSEGIILEDDCLPDPSFFEFCEQMLQKYKNDNRVMMVGGSNYSGSWQASANASSDPSYLFSRYARLWGWATWRRAWQKYDVNMASWADESNKKIIQKAVGNGHWKEKKWVYDQVFTNRKNTWDYQMEYIMLLLGGLAIVPKKNLIQNIGFGNDATHTFFEAPGMSVKRQSLDFPLEHPSTIEVNRMYDKKLAPKRSFIKMILWKLRHKK